MALIDGDEFITGDFLSFQEGNRLKDHWVQSDPQANLGNPQEGMIVYDSDDGKLYLRQAAAYIEIATGAVADEKVKVDAVAAAGYLGAAFNDGVLRTAQDELTFVDGGDFVTLGLADHNTARTALGLAIGTDVLAQQAIGIADDNLLEVDDAAAADDEYCRFTANGIEGRTNADVLSDIGAGDVSAGANLTDHAVVRGDGGAKGVQTSTMIISDDGEMTNPSQPAFFASKSAKDLNVTGDATLIQVICNVVILDQGGNFAGGTFTAPIDGQYQFNIHITFDGMMTDTYEYIEVMLDTSDLDLWFGYIVTAAVDQQGILFTVGPIDMDALDTADVYARVALGTKTVDLRGHATSLATIFAGFLIC